ncbi:MAG: hypothetical protein IIB78_02645 [Proteobacteria bacterium]|nr:hypothetical protein [Pseudomonadota bacterium]MCH8056748.1 hypothetical protein [Pseudomonadota bacterium]MCH8228583.1 hypothetical protein [Pseudomonadota bacterium]
MEKSTLDQLRIERRPESEPSAWRWLDPVILVVAAAAAQTASIPPVP